MNKFTVHITVRVEDVPIVDGLIRTNQTVKAQLYLYTRATSEVRSKKNQATITMELMKNWDHIKAIVENCGSMTFCHLIEKEE